MENEVDIIIDGFSKCLFNRITGKDEQTYVKIRNRKISKKENKWKFDWRYIQDKNFPIYELYTQKDNILQGRISFLPRENFVNVKWVETAPHNLGHTGQYKGTGGHLFAYACKTSFELGFEGYVSFTAKTNLIEHYKKSLNAILISSQEMIINTHAAKIFVDTFYENEVKNGTIY